MPSSKPTLPAAVAALAFLSLAAAAPAATYADQAVKDGLPAYDPKKRTEEPVKEKPAPVAPRSIKRLSDPYARLPEVKIVPGAVPAAPVAPPESKGIFVLPKMKVTGNKEKAPSLPRIFVQPPARKVDEPADPNWETPEGRAARLVEKHITSFDKTLNGHALLGATIEDKAKKAEAREASAKQLNTIADLLELSAALGLDDPAERKRLRAEYQNALLDRPR